MPAFAVLEPPARNRSASEHVDRFVFVRERFSLGAFLFGPLWMISRRLWVVLVIYVVAVGFLEFGLQVMGVGWAALAGVYLIIQVLVGLEAAGLRRWTRLRHGWRDCGVVIADDLEMAERRFFDTRALLQYTSAPAATSMPSRQVLAQVESARPDVIGLFPEPGGGR
jgi:hypothetical protein